MMTRWSSVCDGTGASLDSQVVVVLEVAWRGAIQSQAQRRDPRDQEFGRRRARMVELT